MTFKGGLIFVGTVVGFTLLVTQIKLVSIALAILGVVIGVGYIGGLLFVIVVEGINQYERHKVKASRSKRST